LKRATLIVGLLLAVSACALAPGDPDFTLTIEIIP
jgi:hypothetical protein